MNPLTTGTIVVAGLDGRPVRVALDRCTVLSGDDWWDGHNYERQNRNRFVLRTPGGRYWRQERTRWQGETDGALAEVAAGDAVAMFLSVPEECRRVAIDDAFPGLVIEEA